MTEWVLAHPWMTFFIVLILGEQLISAVNNIGQAWAYRIKKPKPTPEPKV